MVFLILLLICASSMAYEVKEVIHCEDPNYNPYDPEVSDLPEVRCKGKHEAYSRWTQEDTYCEQYRDRAWLLPRKGEKHCVCASGYSREWYPDGPCISQMQCKYPRMETLLE